MSNKKIWVIGAGGYGSVVEHLGDVTYRTPKNTEEFKKLDLIMFTGGEDVHPYLYGGIEGGVSGVNLERDKLEMSIFGLAVKHGIKVTGICRGFQFINVMCGGEMYQHINHHAGMRHEAEFPALGKTLMVTSTHHQLVKPDWGEALPVAWSSPNLSDIYIGPDCEKVDGPEKEIESAVFPNYGAFGVQFHPEMMGLMEPARQLYMVLVEAFLNESMEFFVENYASEVKHVRKSGVTT